MSRWQNWERMLRPWTIPNLTLLLVLGQFVIYVLGLVRPDFIDTLTLQTGQLARGEWWRLLTFLVVPDLRQNPFFLLCGLSLLYLMGSALEAHWGTVRYNVFVGLGYLSCIALATIVANVSGTDQLANNLVLYGSIFLAFAYLYPDFEIMLFFVLPVKVKWLALLTLIGYGLSLIGALERLGQGGWFDILLLAVSNLNLLVFFGRDIVQRLRAGNRRMTRRFEETRVVNKPRHECVVCGATDLTHPDRDFRYCTQCTGTPAYCQEHLAGHVHRV